MGICRVTLGHGLTIGHEIRVQGEGALALANNVQLGYELANGQGQPIILQPRMAESRISIGSRSAIMNGCCLIACDSITIGADVAIGAECLIIDSDFHGVSISQRKTSGVARAVRIGDNVFIGARAVILKGVQIGNDAVVGAGSIVTKDVAAGSIVAGNPARRIGSVYDESGS